MLSYVWNYLTGYVIIQVTGCSVERFLNQTAKNRIKVWKIKSVSRDRLIAYISINGFRKLKELRTRIGCNVHIIEKAGFPFYLNSLKKRPVIKYGWIVVIILLYVASLKIWDINISGCYNVTEEQITQTLQDAGVQLGASINDIDKMALANLIKDSDDKIAWAGVNINGVRMNIKIVEKTNAQRYDDENNEARNIYAKKDGMIKEIIALNGKAVVKNGDIVKEGDLLINGSFSDENGKQINVYSRGSVVADVVYRFSAHIDKMNKDKRRSGEISQYTKINILGYELINGADYEEYDCEKQYENTISGNIFPIWIEKGLCYEVSEAEFELTPDEMVQKGMIICDSAMADEIAHDAKIISKRTEYEMNDDGSMNIYVTVETIEDIGI